jgi:predicted small secreted protein
MQRKEYILLSLIVVFLLFALRTLDYMESPLEKVASLPRCQKNNLIISEELKANIIKFANNYISNGTGIDYFNNHYKFLSLDYSTVDCTFLVKYSFVYDEVHDIMGIKVKAFTNNDFEVVNTRAFLRPVNILLNKTEAINIANEHGIKYDYINLVPDLSKQTFVYKFYRESLSEGQVVVFEVDAQTGNIIKITRPPEITPIV